MCDCWQRLSLTSPSRLSLHMRVSWSQSLGVGVGFQHVSPDHVFKPRPCTPSPTPICSFPVHAPRPVPFPSLLSHQGSIWELPDLPREPHYVSKKPFHTLLGCVCVCVRHFQSWHSNQILSGCPSCLWDIHNRIFGKISFIKCCKSLSTHSSSINAIFFLSF